MHGSSRSRRWRAFPTAPDACPAHRRARPTHRPGCHALPAPSGGPLPSPCPGSRRSSGEPEAASSGDGNEWWSSLRRGRRHRPRRVTPVRARPAPSAGGAASTVPSRRPPRRREGAGSRRWRGEGVPSPCPDRVRRLDRGFRSGEPLRGAGMRRNSFGHSPRRRRRARTPSARLASTGSRGTAEGGSDPVRGSPRFQSLDTRSSVRGPPVPQRRSGLRA